MHRKCIGGLSQCPLYARQSTNSAGQALSNTLGDDKSQAVLRRVVEPELNDLTCFVETGKFHQKLSKQSARDSILGQKQEGSSPGRCGCRRQAAL